MSGRWRLIAVVAAIVVLGAGVLLLRDLTMSRDVATPPGSRTVVEVVVTSNEDPLGPSIDDLVAAALTTCRIESPSEPVGPAARKLHDRYRIVLAPALNDAQRTRYEGCLEDWRIDHLLLDVVTMRTSTPDD